MARLNWAEVERRRLELPGKHRISQAELARRAGCSESTYRKGLNDPNGPRTLRKGVREQVELVLDAAEKMAEAGL